MTFTTPFRGTLTQPDSKGGIRPEPRGDNAANLDRGLSSTISPPLSQQQTSCSIRTSGPDQSLSQYKSTNNVERNHCPSSSSSSENSSLTFNMELDIPDPTLLATFTYHDRSGNKSLSSHKTSSAKKNPSKVVSKLNPKSGKASKSKQETKKAKVTPSYQLPPNMYLTATGKQSQTFQAKPVEDDQCENIDVVECAAIISGGGPVVCEASETRVGSENVSKENLVHVVVEIEQPSSVFQVEPSVHEMTNKEGDLSTNEEISEIAVDTVENASVDLEKGSVGSETNNQLVCDICKKQFKSLKLYGLHISKCEKDLLCFKCKKIFLNKRTLRQHLLQIHLDTKKCDVCGESFSTEKKLAKHKSKVHSTTEIKCEGCNGVFKNKKSLGVHKAKKVCPAMASEGTAESGNSKKHKKGKHQSAERKTYQCEQCPKTYKSDRGLRYHKNIHRLLRKQMDEQDGKNVNNVMSDVILDVTNIVDNGVEGIDYYVLELDDDC